MSEEIESGAVERHVEAEPEVPETEARAAEMGWAPKDQWKGDPDKWIDAETFIERGEKTNGILRERNDKLYGEIQELKSQLQSSVREFGEATRKAEERAYNKALKDLKQQKAQAVEEGDTQAFTQLEQEEESLRSEYAQTHTKPQQAASPDEDPAFKAWHADNSWYNSDVRATAYANQIAPIIAQRHGGNLTRAFYDEVAAEVKKEFPDRFRNTARDKPSPVEGARQTGGRSKKGRGYSDLPPEAKSACDKFVKQKLMTKEQYVKDYFGE